MSESKVFLLPSSMYLTLDVVVVIVVFSDSVLHWWVPKCLSPTRDCQKSVVFGGKMVKIPIPPF